MIGPAEADPPLVVDPNAVLPRPAAFQAFQPVAGRDPQIVETRRSVKGKKLSPRLPLYRSETSDKPIPEQVFGVAICKAPDHQGRLGAMGYSGKRNRAPYERSEGLDSGV